MRVALVHDWLVSRRGGEKVLEELVALFPGADLFTLLYRPETQSPAVQALQVTPSFLQRIPGALRWHRRFLPLFPRAIEALRIEGYDLVVSSSHCVAHGALTPGAVHVSYVHTPMRYMWDRFDDYFGPGRAGPATRLAARAVRGRLRDWDRRTASRPDVLVANSAFVAGRIRAVWGREAEVVHPPVDVDRFRPRPAPEIGDYYLSVGALAPYKRVDLAVRAFARGGRRLLVVGEGPEMPRLQRLRGGKVELLGARPDAEVEELVARCKAFVFPGEEDFGIAPVEALAAGRPVIALGRGGALETVSEETGVLFGEPAEEALLDAVERFEARAAFYDPAAARRSAERFARPLFAERMRAVVDRALAMRGATPLSQSSSGWSHSGRPMAKMPRQNS